MTCTIISNKNREYYVKNISDIIEQAGAMSRSKVHLTAFQNHLFSLVCLPNSFNKTELFVYVEIGIFNLV